MRESCQIFKLDISVTCADAYAILNVPGGRYTKHWLNTPLQPASLIRLEKADAGRDAHREGQLRPGDILRAFCGRKQSSHGHTGRDMTSSSSLKDIFKHSREALLMTSPSAKAAMVQQLHSECVSTGFFCNEDVPVEKFTVPGRPAKPELVPPAKVPRRRLGSTQGRAALVHAIAHIEFNAINLALDAVYRFREMPHRYYGDWISVAADESRHFLLLENRLRELGFEYGDFPAHNGLWQMAVNTDHDCMVRMALVPRVLEARGLDVTPGMIKRLQSAGDTKTVNILRIILEEEIGHVDIGSRWFTWWCSQRALDPEQTFMELLERYYGGVVRGPLNIDARRRAGFSSAELENLERISRGSGPGSDIP